MPQLSINLYCVYASGLSRGFHDTSRAVNQCLQYERAHLLRLPRQPLRRPFFPLPLVPGPVAFCLTAASGTICVLRVLAPSDA